MNPFRSTSPVSGCLGIAGCLDRFEHAVPDFALWLRGKQVVADSSIPPLLLQAIYGFCDGLSKAGLAKKEVDVAVSSAPLATAHLEFLSLQLRLGGVIIAVEADTRRLSEREFEEIVGPSALEAVRWNLSGPVACILRRRN